MDKKTILFSFPVLFFAIILIYLLLWNVYFSFTNWSILNPVPRFDGLNSYYQVLTSYYFRNSLTHSFLISSTLVIVGNLLGMTLAGLLYSIKSNKVRMAYMSIFIYPLTISMSANGLIFLWLFNPNIGINTLLSFLHLPTSPWFSSTKTVLPSLILIIIWAYSGISMLFYLASFMNLDKSIVEAARIDGANFFRIFRKILVPNSMNGFVVSTALLFLFSFRVFSLPFVISGGPSNIYLQTLLIYQYFEFSTSYFANASVASTIVVLIALLIVVPYAVLGMRRWAHH